MSRSGYIDDIGTWALVRWRGAVASATRGKRGQVFLKKLLVEMDLMKSKRLICGELERDGEFCALGVIGKSKKIDMSQFDPEYPEAIAELFDIAGALTREISYNNDEIGPSNETPEGRWTRMRSWVASQIKTEVVGSTE